MKKMVLVGLCAAGGSICQQPKFDRQRAFEQDGARSAEFWRRAASREVVNRDVTMLGLIRRRTR